MIAAPPKAAAGLAGAATGLAGLRLPFELGINPLIGDYLTYALAAGAALG